MASSGSSVTSVAGPRAAAQLVERGVARDPEQPGALGPRARSKLRALAQRAFERQRRDVLGGGAIAQQRGHIGVDVRSAGAVERLERRGRLVSRRQRHGRGSHARTTNDSGVHHGRGAIFVAMPVHRTLLCVIVLAFAAPAAASARAPWATVNVCDTAVEPRHDRDPRLDAGRRRATRRELFMRFQVQYERDDGSWRLLSSGGDSGFIDAGRARTRGSRQAGHSFTPQPAARRQRLHAARPRHVRVAGEGRHRRPPRASRDHRRAPLDSGRRSQPASRLRNARSPHDAPGRPDSARRAPARRDSRARARGGALGDDQHCATRPRSRARSACASRSPRTARASTASSSGRGSGSSGTTAPRGSRSARRATRATSTSGTAAGRSRAARRSRSTRRPPGSS